MLSKDDIQQIDTVVAKRIRTELTPVKEDIAHIRKDMKTIVHFFDREYLELRKRIERMEHHLHLPPVIS